METYKVVQVKGPPLSISGPSFICSEETYIITGAQTVTLKNATGIATLTDLGGGLYKVSRVGTLNGNVVINATMNSQTTTMSVRIGPNNPVIFGPSQPLAYTGLYTFSVIPVDGTTYEWTVLGTPPNSTFNTSGSTINLRIGNGSGNRTIRVSVRASSACGTTSWIERTFELKSGGVLPVEP